MFVLTEDTKEADFFFFIIEFVFLFPLIARFDVLHNVHLVCNPVEKSLENREKLNLN